MLKKLYKAIACPLPADAMARKELECAYRTRLTNLTSLEYYAAQVEFDNTRIKRLEKYLESGL
jgi:hypothetical protein